MKDYNCVITGLKVDAEFQNKIPPLTEDEFRQLEENVLEDGEIYEPIMTWNGVIVDGHNRWKIIQAHPEIPYKVKEMDFADKWAAFEPVINAGNVLKFIKDYHDVIDKVKIGKLNYHPSEINWKDFGERAESICKNLGLDYYIKESLRAEMEKE